MEERKVKIGWYGKHFGEEPPLVKDKGAGGIFFSGCNLRCVFCQNWQISQKGVFQKECSIDEFSEIMLELQDQGALNIDLVSPLLWFREVKKAILIAKGKGLSVPIVWNSNGYDPLPVLREMKGLIDIYLPDFKYGNDSLALKYSGIPNYVGITEKAIKEMLSQVGYFQEDKGLIVRHLVLPNNLENSFQVLNILSQIDNKIHLSLLNQYSPLFRSSEFEELKREITEEEFEKVQDYALELGFENGWIQLGKSQDFLVPDFSKFNPFK